MIVTEYKLCPQCFGMCGRFDSNLYIWSVCWTCDGRGMTNVLVELPFDIHTGTTADPI